MIRLPKSILSFGAVALLAGVITLAVPRAAHAVAAALVQVTNTVSTQDTYRQANQLFHLTGDVSSDTPVALSLVIPTTLPTASSLVITAIDIAPQGGSANGYTVIVFGPGNGMSWSLPAQPNSAQLSTVHFSYPSGIVMAPGAAPSLQVESSTGGGSFGTSVKVDLFGYFTNN
jgi:hypothetical protein